MYADKATAEGILIPTPAVFAVEYLDGTTKQVKSQVTVSSWRFRRSWPREHMFPFITGTSSPSNQYPFKLWSINPGYAQESRSTLRRSQQEYQGLNHPFRWHLHPLTSQLLTHHKTPIVFPTWMTWTTRTALNATAMTAATSTTSRTLRVLFRILANSLLAPRQRVVTQAV